MATTSPLIEVAEPSRVTVAGWPTWILPTSETLTVVVASSPPGAFNDEVGGGAGALAAGDLLPSGDVDQGDRAGDRRDQGRGGQVLAGHAQLGVSGVQAGLVGGQLLGGQPGCPLWLPTPLSCAVQARRG